MLVLHAGPHKTATTYIQDNFAAARDHLDANGWIYPEFGAEGWTGHHHLAHQTPLYIKGEGPLCAQARALAEQARAEGKNLLFSAEGFCRWAPWKFKKFTELMGHDLVDVVYVVREPFSLLYSYWAEEVKQGHTVGFADRFLQAFASPFDDRLLNPIQDLHPFLRCPNRMRLHIVPYDLVMRRGIDIFSHICETVLGLTDVPLLKDKPVNISFSPELTEFLRLLTLIHSDDNADIGPELRMAFTKLTTERQRKEFADLVMTEGSHARRKVTVPGEMPFTERLQMLLKNRLKGRWTLDPGDEPLFSGATRELVYYNEYHLWKTDTIRETAVDLERSLAETMLSPI